MYALKLEEVVNSEYGPITVTIQYDGDGPKIVTAKGDGLDEEIKHMLDTILGLVNFNLAQGINPKEIAEQLEIEPEDGMHLPINEVLQTVAKSLKNAPDALGNISAADLFGVSKDMIKNFTENPDADTVNEAFDGAKAAFGK